eukprot:scaffold113112_cov62-Phaeocystis_antarctica.AAC.2
MIRSISSYQNIGHTLKTAHHVAHTNQNCIGAARLMLCCSRPLKQRRDSRSRDQIGGGIAGPSPMWPSSVLTSDDGREFDLRRPGKFPDMVRTMPAALLPGERGLRGLRGDEGSSVMLIRRATSGKASSIARGVVASRSTPKTCRSLTCSSTCSWRFPSTSPSTVTMRSPSPKRPETAARPSGLSMVTRRRAPPLARPAGAGRVGTGTGTDLVRASQSGTGTGLVPAWARPRASAVAPRPSALRPSAASRAHSRAESRSHTQRSVSCRRTFERAAAAVMAVPRLGLTA